MKKNKNIGYNDEFDYDDWIDGDDFDDYDDELNIPIDWMKEYASQHESRLGKRVINKMIDYWLENDEDDFKNDDDYNDEFSGDLDNFEEDPIDDLGEEYW